MIAIADGRKTVEEIREATNERKIKHRSAQSFRSGTDNQPEKPKEIKEPTYADPVKEAEEAKREGQLRPPLGSYCCYWNRPSNSLGLATKAAAGSDVRSA